LIEAPAPLAPEVEALGAAVDITENDRRDTAILNEMFLGRVDVLITEDRGIARKASRLGVADRLFTIDAFLEKITAENPALVDYRVLSVRKTLFAHVDVGDPFHSSTASGPSTPTSTAGTPARARSPRTSAFTTGGSPRFCT
jgi:hypothetical protein